MWGRHVLATRATRDAQWSRTGEPRGVGLDRLQERAQPGAILARPPPRSSVVPALAAGVIIGVIEIVLAVAFTALIFRGTLAVHQSSAVALLLAGSVALLAVTSLLSSVPGTTGSIQDTTSVLLALAAGQAVLGLPEQARFATAVAVVVGGSAAVGLACLLLGALRLGSLVRFVPYPVIGGFMAGTGWLLVTGGFSVMTAGAPMAEMTSADATVLWLPGAALAVVVFLAVKRSAHPMALPGMLAAALVLFYAALAVSGTAVDEARARGLLMPQAPAGSGWRAPWTLLGAADLAPLAAQGGRLGALVVVTVLGILLSASALELMARREGDLNRELRAAGLANVVSAAVGGAPGYHALSLSALALRLPSARRLAGLAAAAVCLGGVVFGPRVLGYVPRPLLGGLVAFLGLAFLWEWVVEARTKLPRSDHLVVLLIVAAVALWGFLPAFALGIALTLVLFVANYSRTDPVKHELEGSVMRSRVDRSSAESAALRDAGSRVLILELQGYIFFGTAASLWERIRARARSSEAAALRFVVIDFRRVTGVDSSAVQSFTKAEHLAAGADFTLVLTHLHPRLRRQLSEAGLRLDGGSAIPTFLDLDRGLEWCEDRLLDEHHAETAAPDGVRGLLRTVIDDGAIAEAILACFDVVEAGPGDPVIRSGDDARDLFVVERGRLSVYLGDPGPEAVRVRTIGPGAVFGEVGLYLGTRRSATVIADAPSVLHRLSAAAVAQLEADTPRTAMHLHRALARVLAQRLVDTSEAVAALHE